MCWLGFKSSRVYYTGMGSILVSAALLSGLVYYTAVQANPVMVDPVMACVIARDTPLTPGVRERIARCLGWQSGNASLLCQGAYRPLGVVPLINLNEIRVASDEVSFYQTERSKLSGHVDVRHAAQIAQADTAYIYRDAKTNQVTQIKLLDNVHYLEPDKLMIARKVVLNPQDHSGQVDDVLYRFDMRQRESSLLPAWGRARFIQRFPNENYLLKKTTYTTCAPTDNAWQLEANQLYFDHANATGVAKQAVLRLHNQPVLYVPYLSFPTSKARKSGFLLPLVGYSNVGGADVAYPYYWNMAPNYDATIVPHVYTRRGMMMGGDFRFLTPYSSGVLSGHVLPNDRAYHSFLLDNSDQYPSFAQASTNRWSLLLHETTQFNPQLQMGINYQQVSDPYYLQDFSTNLAVLTQNQLLRQGDVTYTTDHWFFGGRVQSYQTLHPINQSVILDAYERLPQLLARGFYSELPMHATVSLLGQVDVFHWPAGAGSVVLPEGPRYHANPILSFPEVKPWGYVTPSLELVENYYDLQHNGVSATQTFNRTIPRYSLDSGLFFERHTQLMGQAFTNTLEPRMYYLYVPYADQTPIPVFDSGYMIFNQDQLFRTNRFSGFDRIGDANQLVYAVGSRWISEKTGQEKASISVGQIHYFSDRQVQLCYRPDGNCTDSSLRLGYTSPLAPSSPITSRAVYQLNPAWVASADYVWDVYSHATNNGHLDLHYQPAPNQLLTVGYTYLVNGDITAMLGQQLQDKPLHQASLAYAWPLTERWSTLGIYSYNVSEGYSMMSFLGVQYDNCCWATRLLGGRTFQSLTPGSTTPQYTNAVYLQILLKGLGSVANSDPARTIQSYLPGYVGVF